MYATVQDFIEIRGEREAVLLSNLDEPGASTVNQNYLANALENATAEMDGHLAARYTIPVTPIPPILRKICIVIARKDMDRYNRGDYIQDDYRDAIASLKRIAKGDELLVGPDGQPIQANEEQKAESQGVIGQGHRTRTFTMEGLAGYGRQYR